MRDVTPISILSRQREYVDKWRQSEGGLGLVVPEAFVRGIRHIGYKSNVEALAELIDNSIQAYAERIDLVIGYADGGSSVKPKQLAVIDDGHGMDPNMLRFAMMWGGTHRENDRHGLGRFGYGLPCATVSMGRRFTIYSKLKEGSCYSVSLDLDLLDNGSYQGGGAEIAIPAAQPAVLPRFVVDAIERNHPQGWESGTVVVVDKLDRSDWATAIGLRRNLLRHFGVTYHKLLTATSIHIDGEQVRPIDPLFLDSEGEFHALDDDRAQALDPLTVTIDCGNGVTGDLTLRYAWLPPTFGATDKSRDAIGMNANARFPIIKACHGLVFSRNGRVVDVQTRTPWTTFINNDRYIRVEVEFSASLDEAFGCHDLQAAGVTIAGDVGSPARRRAAQGDRAPEIEGSRGQGGTTAGHLGTSHRSWLARLGAARRDWRGRSGHRHRCRAEPFHGAKRARHARPRCHRCDRIPRSPRRC